MLRIPCELPTTRIDRIPPRPSAGTAQRSRGFPGQSYAAGSIQSSQCDQSEGAVAVGLRIQNAPIGVLHGRRFLTYYNYNEYDIYLNIDRRRSYPLEHAL